ncbi:MAG TPA: winged helix-turn-helix domain-containing protein [Polyangia bacterium]
MSAPASPPAHHPSCRFGNFELCPEDRLLLADGAPIALGARAFDVLVILVRHAGLLVSKDRLIAEAWPDLVVEENNLQVQVSALRRILGQDAIQTIARHGYRFTQCVEQIVQRSAPSRQSLPRPLTSFVGREADLEEYANLLGHFRLLTLTGIGGSGKTRLAIRLAELVLPKYPDGVWFVDLSPVLEATRTAMTVASILGIDETRNQSILEALCARLAETQLLLVLDNCEHVIDQCAALAQSLLECTPGLQIIATSREGLGVQGERIVAVRPLSVPDSTSDIDVEALRSSEAVRLFLERATLVAPDLTLDAMTGPAIAEICRRLDGIPLAIELAAARIKVLSLDQIRSRLNDRFRLLVGGGRALSRHRTLMTVIQWSYEHLDPDQQRLLRQLSVFAGSWTLAGATAVGGDGRHELQVLDALANLIDKSLVTVQRNGISEPRYRMLETIRHFMEERLVDEHEREQARSRHLTFYLELATQTPRTFVGSQWEEYIQKFDAERENILLAHAWCDHASGGAEMGIRLASATRWYWFSRALAEFPNSSEQSPVAIGYRMMFEALARPGLPEGTAEVGRAHLSAGLYCCVRGQTVEARGHLEKSLAIARANGDKRQLGISLYELSGIISDTGDFATAAGFLEQARQIHRDEGHRSRLAHVLTQLGYVRCMQGQLEAAETLIREGMALAEGTKEPLNYDTTMFGFIYLASVALAQDSTERAAQFLLQALASAIEARLKSQLPHVLELMACVTAQAGDACASARFHGSMDSFLQRVTIHRAPSDSTFLDPFVAKSRLALGDAAFQSAYAIGRTLPLDDALREAQVWLNRYVASVATPRP